METSSLETVVNDSDITVATDYSDILADLVSLNEAILNRLELVILFLIFNTILFTYYMLRRKRNV